MRLDHVFSIFLIQRRWIPSVSPYYFSCINAARYGIAARKICRGESEFFSFLTSLLNDAFYLKKNRMVSSVIPHIGRKFWQTGGIPQTPNSEVNSSALHPDSMAPHRQPRSRARETRKRRRPCPG